MALEAFHSFSVVGLTTSSSTYVCTSSSSSCAKFVFKSDLECMFFSCVSLEFLLMNNQRTLQFINREFIYVFGFLN